MVISSIPLLAERAETGDKLRTQMWGKKRLSVGISVSWVSHLTVEHTLQYALWDYCFFFPLQFKALSISSLQNIRFLSSHCHWGCTAHSDYSLASQGDSSKLKLQTSFYEKIKCILAGCTQIYPLSKMCHNDWQGNDSAPQTALQTFSFFLNINTMAWNDIFFPFYPIYEQLCQYILKKGIQFPYFTSIVSIRLLFKKFFTYIERTWYKYLNTRPNRVIMQKFIQAWKTYQAQGVMKLKKRNI